MRLADLGFLGCWFAVGVDEYEVVVDPRLRAHGGGWRWWWPPGRVASKAGNEDLGCSGFLFFLSFLFFFRT